MARRMEIELTSKREDGTWTWRAAGAREPRGTVDGALVPPATQVGDVVRVEVEGFLDGISIINVLPPKAQRTEPERIDLLAPRSEGPLVTTRLARSPRRERPRRDERGDRGDRGDRDHRRRGRSDRGDRGERGPRDHDRGDRGDRGGRGERGDRERGDRGDRRERTPAPPPVDAKPKPKRLRPAKVHRTALLEALPAEQRPIAEQLLQGGIPAVRQAIEKQNEELKAAGKSQVAAEPLLEIAERLRNRAQAAAWRDRADAALAQVDDLDLRDLRSVVNAAADGGRDEEARNLAAQLREALADRVEKEQAAWVDEVAENLRDGRVVRALRLSSRPPKAGSPLPPDLSAQLIAATGAALTSETGPQRWATILDALAFSPIRRRVVPESLPDKLSADLRSTIARLGTRLPEVAHIFDITPDEAPSRPPRRGKGGGGPGAGGDKGDQAAGSGGKSKSRNRRRGADKGDKGPDGKPADAKVTDAKATDAKADAPATDAQAADAPAPEAEAPTTDAPVTDAPEGTQGEATQAGAHAADSAGAESEVAPTEPATDETVAANAAGTEAAAEATPEAPVEVGEPTEAMVDEATDAAESGDDDVVPAPAAAADATPEAPTEVGEPTEAMVEEAVAEAEPQPEADVAAEGANGTADTNGDAHADDDEGVRIDG
jgi:hypothetical protein